MRRPPASSLTALATLTATLLLAAGAHAASTDPDVVGLAERAARWRAATGKPEAALAVMGLGARREELPPKAALSFLSAAADDAKAHPLARAQAGFLAADWAARTGDPDRAAARREALGLVEAWTIIGPFGFDGGDLAGTPYGPEAGLHPEETGKRGVVTWRTVPAAWLAAGAAVPFADLLRPSEQAAAYALTYIWSDAPRDVALRVGSTGAIKVWAAGRLVVDRALKTRPLGLDQDAGGVRLLRGWTPVLVKLAVEEGGWSFRLRVTQPSGQPLAQPLRAAASPPADGEVAAWPTTAPPGKPPAPPRIDTLEALLVARARGAGPAALPLAEYEALARTHDPETRPIEAALTRAGAFADKASPAALALAARHAESPDRRRAAAFAWSTRPGLGPRARAEANFLLALYYRDEVTQPRRALELFAAAIAADATYWPAELALAELRFSFGLREQATREVRVLVDALPEVVAPRRSLALLEERALRAAAAEAVLAAIAGADPLELIARQRLAELLRRRGDTAAWLAALADLAARRPTSAVAALDLGNARAGQGDVAGALAAFDAALAVAPDDATLLEASGRLLMERGGEPKREQAVARLRRSLVVRPANPELREYLRRVAPMPGDDLEKQYARPVPELIKTWRDFAAKDGDSAVVLLDLKVTRVHDNGQSETFVQRVVRVQDDTGASDERQQGVSYSPDTQTVEVRLARVYKPSGQVVEARYQGEREVSEPWYGLYYDVRQHVTVFEQVEPGDVIEYAYLLSDAGERNLLADYFGDVHYLAEAVPRAESDYVLLSPPARKLAWRVPTATPRLRREDAEVDGEHKTRVHVTRVAKVETDDAMPGWTESAPYLHVSTYASWADVARWYWRLAEPQLVADDAVRAAARAAVVGKTTPLAKVQAIYDLVLTSTRYVGLELGIHSFKPYRVPLVFERRFGDCKDKASLIVVMLREVGIAAELVLVRTRRNGDIDDRTASLAVFDHAIAYVPSLDLYLDGTAEFSGSGELPSSDQGVMVLRVTPPGAAGGDAIGTLTRTPVSAADANTTTRATRIELGAAGGATITDDVTVRGAAAASWRQHYQTPDERKTRYEKAWNGTLPGVSLQAVRFLSLEAREAPVRVEATGTVAQLGTRSGVTWRVPVLGRPSELTKSYARTSTRRHDLLVDFPWVVEDRVEFVLPAGARLAQLPTAGQVNGKFGEVSLAVERAEVGGRVVVRVRARARLDVTRVTIADYRAFRAFLGEVDALLGQSAIVEVKP